MCFVAPLLLTPHVAHQCCCSVRSGNSSVPAPVASTLAAISSSSCRFRVRFARYARRFLVWIGLTISRSKTLCSSPTRKKQHVGKGHKTSSSSHLHGNASSFQMKGSGILMTLTATIILDRPEAGDEQHQPPPDGKWKCHGLGWNECEVKLNSCTCWQAHTGALCTHGIRVHVALHPPPLRR